MNRKLLSIALAMMLLLTACGKPEETKAPETVPAVATKPAPTQTPAPTETEPPETEPPEPVVLFTNPLTGEPTESDISQNRPYAIMLNNLKKAIPQLGISGADIIYEIPAEGGITRMLGVFQSVDGVGSIGSVRSARAYYVSIAAGLDALYLHAGGSPTGYEAIRDLGVAAFDCVNGPYEGSLFWRDAERKSSMGYEHSVITSGEVINELFPTLNIRHEHNDGFSAPFLFDEEAPHGAEINKLTIYWSNYKTGIFNYDEDSNTYLVEEYGAPYADGNNNQQVAVSNVILLQTDINIIPGDDAGRLDVRLTGSGSGILLRDGTAQEITWSRSSLTAPFTYKTASGDDMTLAIGPSYVNIMDSDVSYVLGTPD